jgi:SAM-dependent methyltransferase
MRSLIRKAGHRALEAMGLYVWYSLATRGPLKEDGWLRSFAQGEPVDAAGRPLPWLTYAAIELLGRRVRPEMSVFEYGCGNSTLWWAARVREVIACEHDPAWVERVRARAPGNVTLRQVPLEYGGDYCRTVAAYPGRFDIVVIDGRDRVNCATHAVAALKPDGVIVWDNSDREEYRAGYEHLARAGFHKIEFVGLLPMINDKCETGVFYRDANCLGL